MKVAVYFEAKAGAHMVAQFDEEETYIACFPALEQLAMLKGYTITESLDQMEGEELTDAQLQMEADDLIAKYKHEIVKDRDWWYGTDDYSFNIHSPDEDGWFHVNVYKVDPVTGMDNYEWMIDLPRVYLGGQKEKDPLNQDAIEQEAIGHLNLANTIIYNLEGDKYQAIYEQLEEIIKQMKEAS